MIVVVLKEGLGNQLFQYAAGRCLAEKLQTKLKLDMDSFANTPLRKYSLSHFYIREEIASPLEKVIFRIKNIYSKQANKLGIKTRTYRYFEKGFEFSPYFFQVESNSYIEGYWQSEKNFKPIESIIRNECLVKKEPNDLNRSYLNKISSVTSVSLHIRRGDYVNNPEANAMHGLITLSYYYEAIMYIKERIVDPHFFIFSDDMEWVKNNLFINDCTADYIDHNKGNDYEDMRLMYSCKHNIIANSSFSWWGAWLNNNTGKIVIAPKNWLADQSINTTDLFPENWIIL